MEPDPLRRLQLFRLFFEVLKKMGAPLNPPLDLSIEEGAKPQDQPEQWDKNAVIEQVPNPLHNVRGTKEISLFPRLCPQLMELVSYCYL